MQKLNLLKNKFQPGFIISQSNVYQLTEEFIAQNADTIDWYLVSIYQNLSEAFIIQYKDRLDQVALTSNQNVPDAIKEKLPQIFGQ